MWDTILDLLVTNTSELICDVKIAGSLGCSHHALVEFSVLKDVGQVKSIVSTLNFRKANFQLFRELVNRTSWETVVRNREQNRAIRFLRMLSIERYSTQFPGVRNQKRKARNLLSQDLLVKLKEMHTQWKQGGILGRV